MSVSNYQNYYRSSLNDPVGFWKQEAEAVSWFKNYQHVLDDRNKPIYRWFTGGEVNVCYNAVDRHVKNGRGDQVAIYYHSEMEPDKRTITNNELKEEVSRLAGVIKEMGVERGDRVIIYMPMIPQAVFAMLACARIGAIHSVVFGGFSARVLGERIDDSKPKLILAASCGLEPGKIINYKSILDEAIAKSEHKVSKTLIWQRKAQTVPLKSGFDYDWAEVVEKYSGGEIACEPLKSEDFLYILYTSGTTGHPKGIVRDNAGYMVALLWSMRYLYNMNPGEVYWAMSDIGWVVGHSYIVYAPLLYGCATILFEGKPVGTPNAGVVWKVISEYQVKCLFTAPTAIRAIVREDSQGQWIKKYDISSLESLFLAGERTDPATMKWAEAQLKVPVIDHWWQTETGWAICGNPLGYLKLQGQDTMPVKEGSCTVPMPGWDVQILNEGGQPVKPDEMGSISVRLPMPPSSMPTIWGKDVPEHKNDDAFIEKYLSEFPGYYKTGDAGIIDEDGYLTVLSRTDDIINIAGHRISTGEVEEVIAFHPLVAECAVVGMRDELKGEVPIGFVVLKKGDTYQPEDVISEIIAKVRKEIGSIVVLKRVNVLEKLPKTRSGKILRATIRKIIHHESFPMPPTIEDPTSLDVLKEIFNYPN